MTLCILISEQWKNVVDLSGFYLWAIWVFSLMTVWPVVPGWWKEYDRFYEEGKAGYCFGTGGQVATAGEPDGGDDCRVEKVGGQCQCASLFSSFCCSSASALSSSICSPLLAEEEEQAFCCLTKQLSFVLEACGLHFAKLTGPRGMHCRACMAHVYSSVWHTEIHCATRNPHQLRNYAQLYLPLCANCITCFVSVQTKCKYFLFRWLLRSMLLSSWLFDSVVGSLFLIVVIADECDDGISIPLKGCSSFLIRVEW